MSTHPLSRRALALGLLAGGLALAVTRPAAALPPAPDLPPAERDAYNRKAGEDVRTWQQKLHDFGERTEAKGKEASKATRAGLDDAWQKTQIESRRLRDASAEGWQDAKRGYERASRSLAEAWEKRGADDL